MSSLALYRRYRPESFAEVIGQEHVTDPLMQALRNNRVNHAYLFSGPRGCGKTTSARILARCLNCEQGPTPTPCGTCQSCQDLARNGPGSIDVIEIDAASHGGVDDARDLREKAFFGPASSRYKIYIIDEAHMVTPAGFNALLKVVEEPPEHLKFIFATTEPEKVIGTIRSRTHHYPFRLVPPGTLKEYLAEVCGKEQSRVEEGVLPLVVRAGAGSVRDSMSVMDQLLAGAADDGVTYAMATALLGYTDGSLLDTVVDAFASGDGAAAFGVVDEVIEGGHDPRRFVADLLERLRDLVILAAVPDAAEKGLIDAPAEVVERMQAQAEVFGAAELSRAADLVNAGLTEMRGATSPRLQLELICARVLLPAAYGDERSLQARLDRLERTGLTAGAAGAPGSGFIAAPGQGPALGYAPGPDAHPPMQASVQGQGQGAAAQTAGAPGGGVAAARAAARGGAPGETVAAAGRGTPDGPEGLPGARPGVPGPGAASEAPPSAPGQPGAWPGAAAPTPETAPRPGGWPTAAGPGASTGTGAAGQRPGGWPTAAGAGQGPGAPARPAAPQQSAAPAQPQTVLSGDTSQVRAMWPDILDAVKNRRRFTWILLSQNAQVAGFDGTTLQLGFINAGARDNFASSGSEDVLRQALSEQFHVQWKVEAIVDPSGGTAPPPAATGFGGSGGTGGYSAPAAPPRPAPAPAPQAYTPAPAPQGTADRPQRPPAPEPYRAPRPVQAQRPPVSVEDDVAEDDDPDLDETALTGHDLIVRELGATVVEEYTNE